MRKANKAIIRERIPIPTVDEVVKKNQWQRSVLKTGPPPKISSD